MNAATITAEQRHAALAKLLEIGERHLALFRELGEVAFLAPDAASEMLELLAKHAERAREIVRELMGGN